MQKDPIKINIADLEEILGRHIVSAAEVNYAIKIVGHPGIGKSEVVRQVAQKHNFLFIDTRLAFKENIDLGGYPVPDHDARKMIYYRPHFIPPAAVPDPYDGVVWFLDEVNRAHPTVIQTLFQIITEGVCGEHLLPPNTAVVLAGNLGDSDATALTEFDDAALDGRLAVFHLFPEAALWLKWAHREALHPAVTRYIASFPDRLWDEVNIYPNPRGWHQVSSALVHTYDLADTERLRQYFLAACGPALEKVIQSLIGRVAADDFIMQLTAPRKLSTQDILSGDPQKTKEIQRGNIPAEDILWALSGALLYLREIRRGGALGNPDTADSDLITLANVLTVIGLCRADMRLSFFYQLLSQAAIFTQIPAAIQSLKDSVLAEELTRRFSGLLEEE